MMASIPSETKSTRYHALTSIAFLAMAAFPISAQPQELEAEEQSFDEAFSFDQQTAQAHITGPVTQAVADAAAKANMEQSDLFAKIGPEEEDVPQANTPNLAWPDAPPSIPPALQNAIEIVTENDPAVVASWWRVRSAESTVRSARWQRFPSLTLDGNISGRDNWLLPSLTVDVPVWAGGRLDANRDRARFQALSAESGWEEVVVDLALLVTDTYYEIVLNAQLEQIYSESLAAHRELVGTMERRVAQQISARADLQLAESRTAQIEQELNLIRAQREAAAEALAALIRDPSYELGRAPTFTKNILDQDWSDATAEALEYSPTRARLALEAASAEQDIRLARGSLFPQISAQYAYNDVTGGRVGVGVRMETGNGLSRFAQIDTARADYQTAQNQTRLFERQLRQEIAREVTTNQAAITRTDISLEAALTAAWVSGSYLRQFVAGRRSWLDVMNSLREDLSAKAGLVQAEVIAMSTNARLHIRTGRWRPVRTSGDQ